MYSLRSIMIDNEGRARPQVDIKISSRTRSVSRDILSKWGVPCVSRPEEKVRVLAKLGIRSWPERGSRAFFVTSSRKVDGSPCLEAN